MHFIVRFNLYLKLMKTLFACLRLAIAKNRQRIYRDKHFWLKHLFICFEMLQIILLLLSVILNGKNYFPMVISKLV